MKKIKELVDGDKLTGQFLVGSVSKGANNLGGQYLNIELKDNTGTISGKKWSIKPNDEQVFETGNIVSIDFEVIKYKESSQIKILDGSKLNLNEVDLCEFVSSAPIAKEELEKTFYSYIDLIKDEDYLKVVEYFVNKYKYKIFVHPAAVSVHHEYRSGLLMHTVSMLKLADFIASNYPGINKDLLLSGVILHDLGKIRELEGDINVKYSIEGKLIGHISLMAAEIEEANLTLNIDKEKILLLRHMILSHHGEYEYGSPVLPLTIEALILHLVDNTDSKITILLKALDEIKEGEFTQKIFPLDNRQFYKHK